MKLARFMVGTTVGAGVVDGESIAPLPAGTTLRRLIESGAKGLAWAEEQAQRATDHLPLASVTLLPPVERPGKFLAIGMNYGKHAAEAARLGIAPAAHQLWFNKQTSCISGPYDPIDPGVTEKLDYEVELGVVIGRAAKHVREEDAADHVFGYFVANDVSARDWQFHSPTFTLGKSFDTHGPIGPWLVTPDEIGDPHDLGLRCFVNGVLRQSSNTGDMTANIWQQIAYLSTAFTLEPGDLLATGTPSGVGAAMDPPQFLQPGDVVRCEIDGIGAIENRVERPVVC